MSPSPAVDAFEAFAEDLRAAPSVTLRGGYLLDAYKAPEPIDPDVDAVSDAYLERYWWGIAHLDPGSWRHYLPPLIEYALRHKAEGSMVIDAFLASLRPPDRQPPRLASLTRGQEAVISAFLDVMAFDEASVHQTLARTALEEWWAPGALYRPADAGPIDSPDGTLARSRSPSDDF